MDEWCDAIQQPKESTDHSVRKECHVAKMSECTLHAPGCCSSYPTHAYLPYTDAYPPPACAVYTRDLSLLGGSSVAPSG
jgi:hypothetical protein